MEVAFTITIVALLFTSFEVGYIRSFKEIYKHYRKILFEIKGYNQPDGWPYSRQKNHDRYRAAKWFLWLFLFASIFLGIFLENNFIVFLPIILSPITVLVGRAIGKTSHRKIRKKIKKFGLDINNKWENNKKISKNILEIFH